MHVRHVTRVAGGCACVWCVAQGGKSALLIAVERGFVRVARFLVSAGADARVKNEVRHTRGSCVLSFRSQ